MPTAPMGNEKSSLPPGKYRAEITEAFESTAKSGSSMVTVKLCAVDHDMGFLCMDRFMLEGGGASIGSAKLAALGIRPGKQFEVEELLGRRVSAGCVVETYQGDDKLAVDINAPGSECGYWPETQPPIDGEAEADQEPEKDEPGDDVPYTI